MGFFSFEKYPSKQGALSVFSHIPFYFERFHILASFTSILFIQFSKRKRIDYRSSQMSRTKHSNLLKSDQGTFKRSVGSQARIHLPEPTRMSPEGWSWSPPRSSQVLGRSASGSRFCPPRRGGQSETKWVCNNSIIRGRVFFYRISSTPGCPACWLLSVWPRCGSSWCQLWRPPCQWCQWNSWGSCKTLEIKRESAIWIWKLKDIT